MGKKKTDVRSQKSEDESADSVAPEETLEFRVVETTGREACPTYTIHADERWGMVAMLMLFRLVQEWEAPEGLRREVARVMRDFEMWEEAHRGDAHA